MRHTTKQQTIDQSAPAMTARQVGTFLGGLGIADVQELVETTDIPHRTVKGQLRFDFDELTAWIDRNTVPASGKPLSHEELTALDLDG